MMLMQQGTEVKPPDGGSPGKGNKQKGGLGSTANLAGSTTGATTEQQAQQCPRCDSLNTKFCYYNNYSTSQPRHFCKNCRRYWTRGGALRNVPVGGGCRKNKRLKHRDPSCMSAYAEVGPSGASSMLAAISGCGIPGYGPSSSSLIEDLAQEENRQLTLSRLAGFPVFDKRFLTDNEHCQSGAASAQEFFPFGAGAAPLPSTILSPFDPSPFPFPALPNFSKPESQPLLFHQHHHQTSHELSVFFNPSVTSPLLTPSLEQFAATAPAPASNHNMENGLNTGVIDSQMSLITHGVHMNAIPDSHHDIHTHDFQQQQQRGGQTSASEEDYADANVRMNMMKCKGRPLVSFFSDWTAGAGSNTLQQETMETSNNTDTFYSAPPQVSEGTLWNASWPEMHAALAGSTAAGAMLH